MSDIPVEVCDKERHATCLYRLTTNVDGACSSPDTVLRGCPLIKQKLGCRSKFNEVCADILLATVTDEGGERRIVKVKCIHHIDNVVKKYEMQGIRRGKLGKPVFTNGSTIQNEDPLDEYHDPDWDDEE